MAGFIYPVSKINAKLITKTLIFVQFCGRPPRRGAWIEILNALHSHRNVKSRPPRRGAWIEIKTEGKTYNVVASPPAQGGVD